MRYETMFRNLTKYYGNSSKDPQWIQHTKIIWLKLWRWHRIRCRLCDVVIWDSLFGIKIPRKEGWGAHYGTKEDFILCPDCYDSYEIKKIK